LPIVQPDADVVDTDIGEGEMALLHLATKTYFSLNVTGAHIWRYLKQGLTPSDVTLRLQQEFAVDAEHAERSVRRLIDELVQHRLAHPVSTTA
jgi:hypothetical protein